MLIRFLLLSQGFYSHMSLKLLLLYSIKRHITLSLLIFYCLPISLTRLNISRQLIDIYSLRIRDVIIIWCLECCFLESLSFFMFICESMKVSLILSIIPRIIRFSMFICFLLVYSVLFILLFIGLYDTCLLIVLIKLHLSLLNKLLVSVFFNCFTILWNINLSLSHCLTVFLVTA